MAMDIDSIRKRQLALALGVGVPYFVFVVGIFCLVYLGKDFVTSTLVAGLPLHYWLVAIAIYPVTWAVFVWFVRRADAIERDLALETKGEEASHE